MPPLFSFSEGLEPAGPDSTPLLGRFRAVPGPSLGKKRSKGEFFGSVGPKGEAVGWVLGWWVARWVVVVGLPAGIAVAWCAIPFPQYALPRNGGEEDGDTDGHRVPGHGQARVLVNFWFFLFVYYGFYNFTALMWITKVFNIYSLNWWPQSLGFPLTVSTIAALSIAAPIPLYYIPTARAYLHYNTVWILWTFITMAMPVAVAFAILTSHERHLSLRNSLSNTQRLFTTSWWAGDVESDTLARRDRRRPQALLVNFDPDAPLAIDNAEALLPRAALGMRKLWIPASFVRFMWFCATLSIALLAYVLGETYAEIYLRTLPHDSMETIVYVYSWVVTIHLLDGLTGWILGSDDGERVSSYPLGWVFKLYFSLTYQTYVRAIYARLRSPQQFMLLQLLSSTTLIIIHPLTMSSTYHSLLGLLRLNTQSYTTYARFCRRTLFIRSLAENASMAAFLGQILVLHYGANRDAYPYFAFDGAEGGDEEGLYDFDRTLWLAAVTWGCEIVAAWVVRRVVKGLFGKEVAGEGWRDLRRWPELLPASAVVMVHVLQNMLFGIIRIRFKEP
ncbi:hypothetical protein VC83_06347 [Pseudogymnoascus destructans]|uniref:Uncharacterized protein n=1 Tax=Pseudogymnoascus destructans TaxID=655981 RepID=A0A177A8G7_9PEZI|nr:uncharacterized protein VC83_06347 [Pseudogymnoascus destructans]OAF58437.1 hypothetical protein VC83_06347 [Pseudogymnoascus destructans]